jgi:hypothetical protein
MCQVPTVNSKESAGAPDMIETGIDALTGFYLHFHEGIETPDVIVRTVYAAMEETRIKQDRIRS